MPKRPPLPSVDISKHGRVWKDVPAAELLSGDIVPGKGLVELVTQYHGGAHVTFWSREQFSYAPEELVRAFVKVKPLTADGK